MRPAESTLEQKIAVIRHDYLRRLRDEWLETLAAFRATDAASWNDDALNRLLFLAHAISGSGATFGYAQLSATARVLEDMARALFEDKAAVSAADHAALIAGIDKLMAASGEALKDLAPSITRYDA